MRKQNIRQEKYGQGFSPILQSRLKNYRIPIFHVNRGTNEKMQNWHHFSLMYLASRSIVSCDNRGASSRDNTSLTLALAFSSKLGMPFAIHESTDKRVLKGGTKISFRA